jgi:hypothetical protein
MGQARLSEDALGARDGVREKELEVVLGRRLREWQRVQIEPTIRHGQDQVVTVTMDLQSWDALMRR